MAARRQWFEEPLPRITQRTSASLMTTTFRSTSRDHRELKPDRFWFVLPNARVQARKALEDIAWRFKREECYDFVQYEANENADDRDRPFCWLCADDWGTDMMIGGGAIRWREWRNAPPNYALAWIWIHPYFQHRGLLTKAWPFFMSLFAGMYVEPPFSSAMDRFLMKMQYHPRIVSI